ncbi:MAG: TetR/AcrR family transcriptional regulator [Acidimicrobiia bacterium]|nr:TetR/AcrR family transcriptional regulator [Acidimicrobiia bacterium]
MNTRHTRAKPLSRDDRREAILTAVIPLLIEKGQAVTTAEMAEAAGIAEGTIFRAFPDKAALIHEAVKITMDPAPVRVALEAIDATAPIETQLTEAAHILVERFDRITALMEVLRTMPLPATGPPAGARRVVTESIASISAGLTVLLERHRDRLVIAPSRAAAAFRGLIFANAHSVMTPEEKLTIDEVVGILLCGISARPIGD